mmetsp:Transcript_4053/g.6156  ORF Transcript_4053/g.6156 Transcript_4053/m.6156 type:complete len:85 (-) Transcript_4053:510-764(-)
MRMTNKMNRSVSFTIDGIDTSSLNQNQGSSQITQPLPVQKNTGRISGKRLMSATEIVMKGNKRSKSCTFCKMGGHNKQTCEVML